MHAIGSYKPLQASSGNNTDQLKKKILHGCPDSKWLLRAYYVWGIRKRGDQNTSEICPHGACILVEESDNKQQSIDWIL